MRHLKKTLKVLLLIAVAGAAVILLLWACLLHLAQGEWGATHEYSILQGLEFRNRDLDHARAFIVEPHDEHTDIDAFGVPALDRESGYVWFIANPKTPPNIKVTPDDAPFSITDDDLVEIKQRLQLDPEIEAYLRENRRQAEQ